MSAQAGRSAAHASQGIPSAAGVFVFKIGENACLVPLLMVCARTVHLMLSMRLLILMLINTLDPFSNCDDST